MTVTPGWPQDAKGLSPEIADRGPSEAVAKEVLPPTLFQLPNLRVNREISEAITSVSPDSDCVAAEASEETDCQENSSGCGTDPDCQTLGAIDARPDVGIADNNDQGSEVGNLIMELAAPEKGGEHTDVQVAAGIDMGDTAGTSRLADFPTPSSEQDSNRKQIPPARLPIEVPAGRAWSESIGSQGLVIALLMLVVAAALVSRSNPNEDATEAALAEHSDLLEFDRGETIMIPEAVIPGDFAARGERGNSGLRAGGENAEVFSSDRATESFSDHASKNDLANQHDVSAIAGVTLDLPKVDDFNTNSEAGLATDMPENQSFGGSNLVEAQVVSNRAASSMPFGMEDTTNESASHRLSKTPVGMKNLLQYLPPLPESVPQASAAGLGAQTEPLYAQ